MADDELLRKIDRTLERNTEAFERNRDRDDEFRRYLDALLERHAGITQHLIEAIDSGLAQLQAEIADQREQIQANTQALLRVLDRLGPSPQQG
ncbi:MAG: hypothetical protein ACRDK5_09345 [Solirubrobacterales bacterium]